MLRPAIHRLYPAIAILLIITLFLVTGYNRRSVAPVLSEDDPDAIPVEITGIPLNRHAKQFVTHYIRENKAYLNMMKARSARPFYMINSVFSRYQLPLQLKYLAIIESDLKTTATSRVGAVGPWQLMPETAQQLGLQVRSGGDERTNYDKSTRAAAVYLKDLYKEFGDWLLVLAAYNGGPAPVYRAIRKSGSRNFWALQYYLPAESRIHVKKFIATQYYFERQGSITTLTKAEWAEHASNTSAIRRDSVRSAAIGIEWAWEPELIRSTGRQPGPQWRCLKS